MFRKHELSDRASYWSASWNSAFTSHDVLWTLLHSSSLACVFVNRALIEWLVFRLSRNWLSFLWVLIALPLASGELSLPSGTLSPWWLWRVRVGERRESGQGWGGGVSVVFPACRWLCPLRLISLTLYFNFSLISTGPSGHKSYLAALEGEHYHRCLFLRQMRRGVKNVVSGYPDFVSFLELEGMGFFVCLFVVLLCVLSSEF